MKTLKLTALLVSCLGLAQSAFALAYNLQTADAQKISGNLTSTFYQVSGSGVETPGTTAINSFSSTVGGSASTGWWVNISFGGNPQPILSSAFLKAGNFYLLWDAADLAGFNAGTYDSIVLWNNTVQGIKNPPGNSFLGTSHAGLTGVLGTTKIVTVPDSGSTVALLGLGMIGLFAVSRRRASK